MGKRITTLLGDITPEDLGICDMHEHTMVDMSLLNANLHAPGGQDNRLEEEDVDLRPEQFGRYRMTGKVPGDAKIRTEAFYLKELKAFSDFGGHSMVDCSPIGMRRTREMIGVAKKVQNDGGINIIGATGLYTGICRKPEHCNLSERQYYDLFRQEIEAGMDGTGAKPGIVKGAVFALDEEKKRICRDEMTTIMAEARVAAETGLMMGVHLPVAFYLPEGAVKDMIEKILRQGVLPDKLVLYHQDGTPIPLKDYVRGASRELDIARRLSFLAYGINISLDTWGSAMLPNRMTVPDDYDRMKLLIGLLDAGYEDHIVLGQDFCSALVSRQLGAFGYTRILTFTEPMLEELGYGKEVIRKLFSDNPSRILAY